MTDGWGFDPWGQGPWASVVDADAVAPTFAGLASAVAIGADAVLLSWASATDDATPQPYIAYRVYQASSPGAEDFQSPIITTALGQLSYVAQGLTPGATYYFVVRALDQGGNEDTNQVERAVTMPEEGGGGGGGTGNTIPPVITLLAPTGNQQVGPRDSVIVEVTDDEGDFRRIIIAFDISGTLEIAYDMDGDGFQGLYAAGTSSRAVIAGGFRFDLLRRGGWPPGAPRAIKVYAVDASGNEARL